MFERVRDWKALQICEIQGAPYFFFFVFTTLKPRVE